MKTQSARRSRKRKTASIKSCSGSPETRRHTDPRSEQRLLIEFKGKLLYLGEPEDFSLTLPFWDHNLRDVIEATSTRAFNRMCREVSLLRKFESKFREMKLAFQIGGGDPKQMALACYRDLIEIHDSLIAASLP